MSNLFRSTLLIAALLMPICIVAEETELKADVTISVQSEREIWTGQQITIYLDLKTTGFSFSNTLFNLPEVGGAFLMQTDTTTIKLTEKIEGRNWQVVRYPLALYPQKSGQLIIPPINVRFSTSAGFGSQQKEFEFQTRELSLSVSSPPGVKQGDVVVATTALELDYNWQPASGTAQAGDAATLTVNRRARDISAILLPPIPVYRAEGLAAYPQAPQVNDKTDRGDLSGERTDSIIWVIEKPGVYEIPAVRFQWWDPVKRELKQQTIPGLSLDVRPLTTDSTEMGTPGEPDEGFNGLPAWLMLFIAGFLTVVGWMYFRQKSRDRLVPDERFAFASLQKACKSNNAGLTHSATHAWLLFYPPAPGTHSRIVTLNEFARLSNDRELAEELERLQEALVSSNSDWRGYGLLNALKKIRRQIKRKQTTQANLNLAPLNP